MEMIIDNILVAIVSTCTGTIVGTILGFYFKMKMGKYEENRRLYDLYYQIGIEMAESLQDMLLLSLRSKTYTLVQLEEQKQKVSALYFKYYTKLPQEVLLSLVCLHSCLQSGGKRMYRVKLEKLKWCEKIEYFCKLGKVENSYEIQRCNTPNEIMELFREATLVSRGLSRLEHIVQNNGLRTYLIINIQARLVIRNLDKYIGGNRQFKLTQNLKNKVGYKDLATE
ncbi:MAG: hypothetical protein ACI3Z5_05105 [Paludibacteraceae bacterium]